MTADAHEFDQTPAEPTDITPQAWQTVADLEWFNPREGAETVPTALYWSISNATVLLQSHGEGVRSIVYIDQEANQTTGIPRADVYTLWTREKTWFLQRDVELPAQGFTAPAQPSPSEIQRLENIIGALQDYKSQFDILEDKQAEWRAASGAFYDNYFNMLQQYFQFMQRIGSKALELYTLPFRTYLSAANKPH